MKKLFSIPFLAVLLISLASCVQFREFDSVVSPDTHYDYSTKTATDGTLLDSFSFIAGEKDIRAFVKNHQPLQQICSLEPVERNGDTLLYIVNYDGFFYGISSITVGNYHFTSDQQVIYNIH